MLTSKQESELTDTRTKFLRNQSDLQSTFRQNPKEALRQISQISSKTLKKPIELPSKKKIRKNIGQFDRVASQSPKRKDELELEHIESSICGSPKNVGKATFMNGPFYTK